VPRAFVGYLRAALITWLKGKKLSADNFSDATDKCADAFHEFGIDLGITDPCGFDSSL
jgi:hypothetical protein